MHEAEARFVGLDLHRHDVMVRAVNAVLTTSHIRSELRGDSWLRQPADDRHGGAPPAPDAPRCRPRSVTMIQA
jgi:hypothetical protein